MILKASTRFVPALACLILSASFASADQHTIIASWTFEEEFSTESGSEIGPISPEVGSGAATGFHVDDATVWSTPLGNGSPRSLNSNRWATGDYYQFEVSTLSYSEIELRWDLNRSGTGPEDWELQYSVDGIGFDGIGSPFSVSSLSWTSGSENSNSIFTEDLVSLSAVNDQTSVIFRLVAMSDPGGVTGAARVDNFTVTGISVIPEPSTYAACLGILLLVGSVAYRRVSKGRK